MGNANLLKKHTIHILNVRLVFVFVIQIPDKIIWKFFIIIYMSKNLLKHLFDYFSFNSNFPNSHHTGCERVTVTPPPFIIITCATKIPFKILTGIPKSNQKILEKILVKNYQFSQQQLYRYFGKFWVWTLKIISNQYGFIVVSQIKTKFCNFIFVHLDSLEPTRGVQMGSIT